MRVHASTASEPVFRVDADLLIPGRGEPVSAASLVVRSDQIAYVGKQNSLPEEFQNLRSIHVPVLMPGLWDCHVHYFGSTEYNTSAITKVTPALAGVRAAKDLIATLNAGFTSVRELGGYGVEIAQAVNEGWIPGPNIYSSVSVISPTAGHADARDQPLDTLQDNMRGHGCLSGNGSGLSLFLCDGVPECTKAVRLMIRRGATLIKVATSGGVACASDPHHQQFSSGELNAIVDEAKRGGMIVAAHCHGVPGVRAALDAGCGTVEHGSWVADTDGAIHDMKKNGVIFIATRAVLDFGRKHPEAWDKENYQKLLDVDEANRRSYEAVIKAGVKIALGTDLGISSQTVGFLHGSNGIEFKLAVEAGLTELEAIEAGTATAPETLGTEKAQKIKKGQLKMGWDADFIAVNSSPLENIDVLSYPENITHVYKAGKLVKSPGKPVSIF